MTKKKPVIVLYHGTCAEHLEDILNNGLGPVTYLTDRLDMAQRFAASRGELCSRDLGPIVIEVPLYKEDLPHLELDSFMLKNPMEDYVENAYGKETVWRTKDWQKSLRLLHAVRLRKTVPVTLDMIKPVKSQWPGEEKRVRTYIRKLRRTY